jgi:hypothetical protein
MKLSAIARYWAARELTRMEKTGRRQLDLKAPFACPDFTFRMSLPEFSDAGSDKELRPVNVRLGTDGRTVALAPVSKPHQLTAGTVARQSKDIIVCFDLPRGTSRLVLE